MRNVGLEWKDLKIKSSIWLQSCHILFSMAASASPLATVPMFFVGFFGKFAYNSESRRVIHRLFVPYIPKLKKKKNCTAHALLRYPLSFIPFCASAGTLWTLSSDLDILPHHQNSYFNTKRHFIFIFPQWFQNLIYIWFGLEVLNPPKGN